MITEEIRKLRKNGIGGSDCAAVLGLSRWKNPLQIFLEKTSESLENIYEEVNDGPAYWGNVLEDVVAKEFSKQTGKKIEIVSEQLIHPKHNFLIGNIDRKVIGENSVLECKTTAHYNAQYWENEEVPMEYLVQVMHYLAVTGFQKGYLAVLIGGNKFVWKEIPRNEELIQKIVDREVYFWKEFVEKKIPPMIDGSEASDKIIKMLYPKADDSLIINLNQDFDELLNKRDLLKNNIDTLSLEKDEIENKVKFAMGEAAMATTPSRRITYKNQITNRLNTELLKKEVPDIYSKYLNAATTRRLLIKELKND